MTTRRQLLAAAIAAPAIALPATASALVCTDTEPSAAWLMAVANYDAATHAAETYHRRTYLPARSAAKQQRHAEEWELQRQIDAIPHHTTQASFVTAGGSVMHMSTARSTDVKAALGNWSSRNDDDFSQCCREMVTALRKRLVAEREIRDRFKFSPDREVAEHIRTEYDRLERISNAAFRAVVSFKASTIGDLIAKITYLKSEDCEVDHDELLADLARIFGEARS